ncbi:Outer membrane porin protein 32 precursor [compost metagenome]
MKKPTAAIAALIASSAVSAQSSLTLFGVVDAGVSHYSLKSSPYSRNPLRPPPLTMATSVRTHQTALSTSGTNASRIGFRGTEDLGGGLAAHFWLESPLNIDTGTGMSNFSRRSTVSLSGPFGEFRFGRDLTATFLNDIGSDPFVTNGVGTNVVALVGAYLAMARGPGSTVSPMDNYVYTSNGISYFLPPNLGGFYGNVQYALHENVRESGLPGSRSSKGRYMGARAGFSSGRLDISAAWGESIAADKAAPTGGRATEKLRTMNVGGTYDLSFMKLWAELSRMEDRRTDGFTASRQRDIYNGGLIAVSAPIGPGVIKLAYSRVKFENGNRLAAAPFGDPDASVSRLALGYVHNLSKRTALYATVSKTQIRNGQNNPAVMGIRPGGSASYISTGDGQVGFAPRSAMGYDFGMRVVF